MNGFRASDPTEAVSWYKRAERKALEAVDRKSTMAAWIKQEEMARQQAESKLLNRSLSIKLQKFQAEWAEKKTTMEKSCDVLIATNAERADAERIHLEHQLEREKIPKVKYRPKTRDGLVHAMILSKCEKFDQVVTIHNRLQGGKKQEEDDWAKEMVAKQAARRTELEEKLAREEHILQERVLRIRGAFEKRMAKAKDEVMQNCKNLKLDMEAAFKREWFSRPEVAVSAKKSRKSRVTSSATFMGSIMHTRALGGKHDLPSVSRTHFDEEEHTELDGSLRDSHIVRRLDVSDLSPPPPTHRSLPLLSTPTSLPGVSPRFTRKAPRGKSSARLPPVSPEAPSEVSDASITADIQATVQEI